MSSVLTQDEKYMMQALKLASCGLYTSYPNPAVGCVIVRDGKVIGKGYHHKAGEPHAEIMAVTDASFDVEGATATKPAFTITVSFASNAAPALT